MEITQDDIMKALEDALAVPTEGGAGKTTQEIMAEKGMSEEKVRKGLRKLQQQGRLVVSTVIRPSISGRPQSIPAYSIKGGA